MIPGIRTRPAIVATTLLGGVLLSACDRAEEPTREPPGPRAEGPTVDPAVLENDPVVAAFRAEAARYVAIAAELAPLETALGSGTISEEDTARWRELDAERNRERSRLNRLMYAESVTAEQRAAMWWVLRGDAPTTGE